MMPIYYKIGNEYVGKLEESDSPQRRALANKLENGDTPIMVSTELWETELTDAKDDVIVLGPGALQKGEAEIIAEELKQILTIR